MVVTPLWRGLGNIHGFVLDGKSYREGYTTDYGEKFTQLAALFLLFRHGIKGSIVQE